MSPDTTPVRDTQADNRKVAFGALATGTVNLIKIAIQLLLLPVMARLLGPDEFGLYALALPSVSLIAILSDAGLGASLSREDESSSVVWSSAFWVLALLGIMLTFISALLGVIMGYVAGQPRVSALIALLSISLFFMAMAVVPSARLTRRKNLGLSAVIELTAAVAGTAVAVFMAWEGAGAWSLAAQFLVTYALRSLLLNLAAFHLPRPEFNFKAIRPHMISGGFLVGSRLSDYAGRATENILVFRIFGTATLGNYSFASQISKYATDSVSNVVWAALYVQALTGDKEGIAVLYRRLCRLLGVLLFPASFIAAAAAPELVQLLLGPKWVDLSFLLRFLLPLYTFHVILSLMTAILLAYGHFRFQFWSTVGLSLGRVIAIALGMWIGLAGAIIALAIVFLLYGITLIVAPAKATNCNPSELIGDLLRPAISAVLAAGVYLIVTRFFDFDNFARMISGLFASMLAYVILIIIIDRKDLMRDWTTIRMIATRQRPEAGPDPALSQ